MVPETIRKFYVNSMKTDTPVIVQYQGSKRLLAPSILRYLPDKFDRLIEPFSGLAAISIAAASQERAKRFHINDINRPVIGLLHAAINTPEELLKRYSLLWKDQFTFPGGHINHFYKIRSSFNNGDTSAEAMLYLLSRCVKGSVCYGKNGNFNQSPDKRRHGVKPETLARNLFYISKILKNRTTFSSCDYKEILNSLDTGDIIYMDPPYQGVSNTRDHRYLAGVDVLGFTNEVKRLDAKKHRYVISYDGRC